jgi:hypothetical protein
MRVFEVSQCCVVCSYLGVGAAAGDGVAAVAVGGLGRHFCFEMDVFLD